MSHPISRFMPSVFVPVPDLKAATEWYAELLERQIVPQPGQEDHGIYIFDFHGTEVILDRNMWGSPPMIMFDAQDIEAAHTFCEGYPHTLITDVISDEYVSVFNLNAHIICKANRDLGLTPSRPAHALLGSISHIMIHADDLPETTRWYEEFLARGAEPVSSLGGLPRIRMDRGAHLLIDDNRLSQSPRVFFEKLQLDMRVNPIAMIESSDLSAALDHVRSKGAAAGPGIETRFGIRFFVFQDPYGNSFMVSEKIIEEESQQ